MKMNWIKMTTTIPATCLALVFLACGVHDVPAGEALPGSPDFSPSARQPVGWRGDGTGKYPGANPPIHWNRTSKQAAAMKCSSAVPTNQSPANAMSAGAGFFTEWLVAAPISCANVTNAIAQELTPGEAAMSPQEGDKIGDTTWKRVPVDNSYVDVWKDHKPMTTQQAAYAQACLYSEKPAKIWLHARFANHSTLIGATFWLNGKPGNLNTYVPFLLLDLQPGWNRFLFKFLPRTDHRSDFPDGCFVQCRFWPAEEPRDYDEKNIAWITPMPGLSEANPIIVGDRIFTSAHPYNLVCVDKKTGKILWVRPSATYDAATAEDRSAKPELFVKLDDLAKKREAYYSAFVAGTLATNQTAAAEIALEDQMDKLMIEVNSRYKKPDEQGEPNWWEIPTPASDGKNVCIFLARGVSACYDLEGKRRWVRYERPLHQHHGFFSAPVIADGKFFILDGTVTALDLVDGSVKSSLDLTKTKSWRIVFASLGRLVFGGKEYVLYPDGTLIRASDGKVYGPANDSGNATPVFFDENKIFWPVSLNEITTTTNGEVRVQNLKKEIKWPKDMPVVPGFYAGDSFQASPVVHDGLAYLVRCWGSLVVLDLATMEVVYEHVLPLDLFQIDDRRSYFGTSVALAGDYIYLMGSSGVMIVIKPGRKYEEVGRNRIHYLGKEGRMMGSYLYPDYYKPRCVEYQDCTMTSTPIFDGNRMYYRGMENLYCVEQNVWALQSVDVSRGEAPLTVKFDAGKSHAMLGKKLTKYAWDFSDGQTASGVSAEHTYKAAGTYIARLTVTDEKGATDEAETTITVMPVDTVAPAMASVVAKGETNVLVKFNEKVEQTSAGNAENYALSRDVKVLFAAIQSDPSEVNLVTTPLAEDIKYELTVRNVRDCARQPNTIAQKSSLSFYRFRSPPDEDGYIRNWLRLSLIPLDAAGEKEVFSKEFFTGQNTCAPNEGDKVSVGGKELAWKVVKSNGAVVPLRDVDGKAVYFGVTYLACQEDISGLRLRVGGAHNSSLWRLNGEEVVRVSASGSTGDQTVSGPVTLKKGRNVLMAQVVNSYGGAGISARFVDKDGNPVGDYNVSTGAALTPAPPPGK